MIKYFNVNNNKIACWVNPADFGAHAQSFVFIHGSGGTSDAWSLQYSKLHTDFNILAVNLPGHGGSEGTGEQYVEGYVSHLKEILDTVGLKRPILVGHSLGAASVHEAIYCLLMLRGGFMAGSANIAELDPRADGFPILRESTEAKLRTVMSNSFGFGGTNGTLVFGSV